MVLWTELLVEEEIASIDARSVPMIKKSSNKCSVFVLLFTTFLISEPIFIPEKSEGMVNSTSLNDSELPMSSLFLGIEDGKFGIRLRDSEGSSLGCGSLSFLLETMLLDRSSNPSLSSSKT